MRVGEYLIALLERHGVRLVFGIPGVHTAELYRGLAGSAIRHVSPRHEQGAGFMADGYARVTGKPGVCFVITGPGLTNIATAMAQAYADSIPMLIISSVRATADLGKRRGHLHELPDQQGLAAKLAAESFTIRNSEDLPGILEGAFRRFASARPRPIHIEIPIDILAGTVAAAVPEPAPLPAAPLPPPHALREAADRLRKAQAPLLLLGGGARAAGAVVTKLAERLGAPAVMTVNGRGLLPFGHPLAVAASPSLQSVRALIEAADVVLAIGTEIGPTDYDMYQRGGFRIPGALIRVDIEGGAIVDDREPDLTLAGDATAIVRLLLAELADARPANDGATRAAATREQALAELSPAMQRQVVFLNSVRDALPNAIIVGDSTQPVYAGNLFYEAGAPNGWFNSAVGYGTLGYALPAAIGAKLGAPERPVICLVGDGGLQFVLGELGSAIDAKTPIVVLVWNNRGYGEIKTYMQDRGIAPLGVDLATPDFCAIARAYGWEAERLANADDLAAMLQEAPRRSGPTLVEIDETIIMRG